MDVKHVITAKIYTNVSPQTRACSMSICQAYPRLLGLGVQGVASHSAFHVTEALQKVPLPVYKGQLPPINTDMYENQPASR